MNESRNDELCTLPITPVIKAGQIIAFGKAKGGKGLALLAIQSPNVTQR